MAARAAAVGVDPYELVLELMLQQDGHELLMLTHENYAHGSLDAIREMVLAEGAIMGTRLPARRPLFLSILAAAADPTHTVHFCPYQHHRWATVCAAAAAAAGGAGAAAAAAAGIGDAGAHCSAICDGSWPTTLLTHWARDRDPASQGPQLPLGLLVQRMTKDTAQAYHLHDRGILQPGLRADLNVIDLWGSLSLEPPRAAYDLPLGGRRILQRARGYLHTFCAGVEVIREDEPTGAMPGRLLRCQPSQNVVPVLPVVCRGGGGDHEAKL